MDLISANYSRMQQVLNNYWVCAEQVDQSLSREIHASTERLKDAYLTHTRAVENEEIRLQSMTAQNRQYREQLQSYQELLKCL